VSLRGNDGGGICCPGSLDVNRRKASLAPGLPGTMAPILTAMSRRSMRSFVLRSDASGPWQTKQVFDRTGRISRSKSVLAEAAPAEHNIAVVTAAAQIKSIRRSAAKRMVLRLVMLCTLR